MHARRHRAAGAAVTAGACVAGCQALVIPPLDPVEPVSVFLIDYGRHASLALPEPPAHTLVEYTYGEWNWFALDRSAWYDVLPTLLLPTRGALGRRHTHLPPDPATLQRTVPWADLHEIRVSAANAYDLAEALDAEFQEHIQTLHDQPLHGLSFVHSDRSFHLLHNCNHAVAEWLRRLGCKVEGPTVLAEFVVRTTSVQ